MESGPLVLVADTDPDTREMCSLSLGLSGFTVALVSDGIEAWEKIQALLPDVVLTDLSLPRLDGTALCHRVHEDPRTADIPVIAVTAWAGKSVDEEIRAAHFQASLLKPVALDALVKEIREAMSASRSLRAQSEDVRARAARLVDRSNLVMERSETLKVRLEKSTKA